MIWVVKYIQEYVRLMILTVYTAISRKVVAKVNATIPKSIVSGFEFTLLQRNLKEWHERPWRYVSEC